MLFCHHNCNSFWNVICKIYWMKKIKHIVLTRLCIVFIRLSSKERFYQIWRIMLHGALLRENKSYCRVVSPSQQLIILAVLHLYPVVSRAGVLRSSAVKILCKLFYEHFSINGSCSLIVCVVESEMNCFWFQWKSFQQREWDWQSESILRCHIIIVINIIIYAHAIIMSYRMGYISL